MKLAFKICNDLEQNFVELVNKLTPFLPGMAHSQFIRLRVPSVFLVGRATNPYKTREM